MMEKWKREQAKNLHVSMLSAHIDVPFAPAKPLYNRRAPRYLRGLIRKPLREIIVILPHHAERG